MNDESVWHWKFYSIAYFVFVFICRSKVLWLIEVSLKESFWLVRWIIFSPKFRDSDSRHGEWPVLSSAIMVSIIQSPQIVSRAIVIAHNWRKIADICNYHILYIYDILWIKIDIEFTPILKICLIQLTSTTTFIFQKLDG